MPMVSVNMAQPCKPYTRESQIYILPTADDDGTENETVNNIQKKKYVIIKMIEFVSIFFSRRFRIKTYFIDLQYHFSFSLYFVSVYNNSSIRISCNWRCFYRTYFRRYINKRLLWCLYSLSIYICHVKFWSKT